MFDGPIDFLKTVFFESLLIWVFLYAFVDFMKEEFGLDNEEEDEQSKQTDGPEVRRFKIVQKKQNGKWVNIEVEDDNK